MMEINGATDTRACSANIVSDFEKKASVEKHDARSSHSRHIKRAGQLRSDPERREGRDAKAPSGYPPASCRMTEGA